MFGSVSALRSVFCVWKQNEWHSQIDPVWAGTVFARHSLATSDITRDVLASTLYVSICCLLQATGLTGLPVATTPHKVSSDCSSQAQRHSCSCFECSFANVPSFSWVHEQLDAAVIRLNCETKSPQLAGTKCVHQFLFIFQTLTVLYDKILRTLQRVPEGNAYRVTTEATIQERLAIVKSVRAVWFVLPASVGDKKTNKKMICFVDGNYLSRWVKALWKYLKPRKWPAFIGSSFLLSGTRPSETGRENPVWSSRRSDQTGEFPHRNQTWQTVAKTHCVLPICNLFPFYN